MPKNRQAVAANDFVVVANTLVATLRSAKVSLAVIDEPYDSSQLDTCIDLFENAAIELGMRNPSFLSGRDELDAAVNAVRIRSTSVSQAQLRVAIEAVEAYINSHNLVLFAQDKGQRVVATTASGAESLDENDLGTAAFLASDGFNSSQNGFVFEQRLPASRPSPAVQVASTPPRPFTQKPPRNAGLSPAMRKAAEPQYKGNHSSSVLGAAAR